MRATGTTRSTHQASSSGSPVFDKDRQIVGQETVFQDYGRVRSVTQGPDGLLYLLLQDMNGDTKGGSIIRLVPAN